MKKKLAPIVIGLGLIGLAGCSDDNGNGNDEKENGETEFGNVLSTSDAGEVTTDDILNQMGTSTVANQTFQLTLDNILKDKYSDSVDTEKIESQIDSEIEQMGGEEQFAMALQQQQPGMTVEKYKQQRITNAYHDKFFEEKFAVTDEKAKKNTREASHILIAVKDEEAEKSAPQGQAPQSDLTDEEAKKKAEDIKKQLEEGADFGELAKKESHDTGSAQNNGSLGYVQKGQMVEGFDKALFELEKGEVSDVVKSEFGYHIIKRHKEEKIDEELPQIKKQMVSKKIQENQDKVLEYYKEVLEEYNADFENEEIKTFIEDTYLNPESKKAPEQSAQEQPAEGEKKSKEEKSTEEDAE